MNPGRIRTLTTSDAIAAPPGERREIHREAGRAGRREKREEGIL